MTEMHLWLNMGVALLFGGFLEQRFGHFPYLILLTLTGVVPAIVFVLIYPDAALIGFSNISYGIAGMMLAYWFFSLRSLAVALLLFLTLRFGWEILSDQNLISQSLEFLRFQGRLQTAGLAHLVAIWLGFFAAFYLLRKRNLRDQRS